MCLPKFRRARALVWRPGGEVWLQVDGGIAAGDDRAGGAAGADVFVAGSAVYGAEDPGNAVRALRAQADQAWLTGPLT